MKHGPGEGELDPLIHVPARLRLVAALAQLGPGDALSFPRLQSLLELTAGNLLTHLRKLEDAGYAQLEKKGGSTRVQLTNAGRAAFERYRAELQKIMR